MKRPGGERRVEGGEQWKSWQAEELDSPRDAAELRWPRTEEASRTWFDGMTT